MTVDRHTGLPFEQLHGKNRARLAFSLWHFSFSTQAEVRNPLLLNVLSGTPVNPMLDPGSMDNVGYCFKKNQARMLYLQNVLVVGISLYSRANKPPQLAINL